MIAPRLDKRVMLRLSEEMWLFIKMSADKECRSDQDQTRCLIAEAIQHRERSASKDASARRRQRLSADVESQILSGPQRSANVSRGQQRRAS